MRNYKYRTNTAKKHLFGVPENELGSEFDIREFHEQILEKGTLTLPLLELKILNYIKKTSLNRLLRKYNRLVIN